MFRSHSACWLQLRWSLRRTRHRNYAQTSSEIKKISFNSVIKSFNFVGFWFLLKRFYLYGDFHFVRPSSPPNNEAKDGEQNGEETECYQSLASSGEMFIFVKFIVFSFFQYHITFGPSFFVSFPASFSTWRGPEYAGKTTSGGISGVAAERRMRRGFHGTIETGSWLHGCRLIPIVRISWRALYKVHWPFWRSWWRWWC